MNLCNYTLICDGIVKLMAPLVEIVIHDISKNKIIYINGKLSARAVGDDSLLEIDELDNLDEIIYPKINFDGRLVKSISVKLDENHLICINCDVSIFNKMQELSNSMLLMNNQPKSLFINDWQERLHVSIHNYLQNHNLSFENISQNDKKTLTKYLFDQGAFNEKNAADYIAKVLQLSRATVFKYLKMWRN